MIWRGCRACLRARADSALKSVGFYAPRCEERRPYLYLLPPTPVFLVNKPGLGPFTLNPSTYSFSSRIPRIKRRPFRIYIKIWNCPWVCVFIFFTPFPASDFKSDCIFGILGPQRTYWNSFQAAKWLRKIFLPGKTFFFEVSFRHKNVIPNKNVILNKNVIPNTFEQRGRRRRPICEYILILKNAFEFFSWKYNICT